jgi:hypothetical protein
VNRDFELKIGVLEMKKYFKSSLLFFAVISASLFMILESGEYYQKFYQNSYQGYWAAFLVESFLAIAAMLHFKGKKTQNILIKLMMIPLFLVVVATRSTKKNKIIFFIFPLELVVNTEFKAKFCNIHPYTQALQ